MTLADVLTYVLAPLAIGPVLDSVSRPAFKGRVSALIERTGSRGRFSAIHASKWLDHFFGPKLFSKRAVFRTLSISIVCAAFAYAVALVTTIEHMSDLLVFDKNAGFIDWLCIVAVAICTAVADVICFAQTRMFIKAAETYDTPPFIALLVAADIFASIIIFVMLTGIGVTVSFVCVLLLYFPSSIDQTTNFSPRAAAAAIEKAHIKNFIGGEHKELANAIVRSLENYSPGNKNSADAVARSIKDYDFKNIEKSTSDTVVYSVSERCKNDRPSTFAYSLYSTYYNSWSVIYRIALSTVDLKVDSDAVQKDLETFLVQDYNPPCGINTLDLKQSIVVRRWVADLHPMDFYLSSVRAIALPLFLSSSKKLSDYVYIDPFQDMNSFLEGAISESATTALGLKVNYDKVYVGEFVKHFKSDDEHFLRLPLGPMMGASMFSSFIFCVFAMLLIVTKTGVWIIGLVLKSDRYFNIAKYPFSIAATGFSACAILLLTASSLAQFLWRIII